MKDFEGLNDDLGLDLFQNPFNDAALQEGDDLYAQAFE